MKDAYIGFRIYKDVKDEMKKEIKRIPSRKKNMSELILHLWESYKQRKGN